MPSINILLPTYEPSPAHLREAIESVLAQTEKDWTLLIHDDASVADVRAMVQPYLSDPRVTFVRSPVRLRIGGNWNACLKSVDAPFLQYIFQDDAWAPHLLETGLRILREQPAVGIVTFGYRYKVEGGPDIADIYEQAQREKDLFLKPGLHDGRAFLHDWAARGLHPCIPGEPSFVMLHTDTTHKAGEFLEDMPQYLDGEYWSRMLLHGAWWVVPGAFGFFRAHGASTSMQNHQRGVGLYDRLRALDRIHAHLPASVRRNVDDFFRAHLALMIRKFFRRRSKGLGISSRGGGAVVVFALRHPLLTMLALSDAVLQR